MNGAPRIPKPARPRLVEALAAVTRAPEREWRRALAAGAKLRVDGCWFAQGAHPIDDPAEAWEVLEARGLVGSDPRRVFECRASKLAKAVDMSRPGEPRAMGRVTVYTGGTFELAHPATIDDCIAVASDPQGIVTAEHLARETTGMDRIVWRVVTATEVAEHIASVHTDHRTAALHAHGYCARSWGDGAATLLCPVLGAAKVGR